MNNEVQAHPQEASVARIESGLARLAYLLLMPLLAMHVAAGYIWDRPWLWQLIMAALLAGTWWSRRWVAARTLGWCAFLLALFGVLHIVELVAGLNAPPQVYMNSRAGRSSDLRSLFEVWDDEKAAGRRIVPAIMPGGAFDMNHRNFRLNGAGVTPLSSFSGITTILCNEGGTWQFYEADEHGFNNPPGLWDRPLQIGVVGDSFTHAACVLEAETASALMRRVYPGTVNLGMGGNGPMLELAGIKEYLSVRKPKVVLQLYYENDVNNLATEWSNPNLRAYLTQRDYRAGLFEHQAEVDRWLHGVLAQVSQRAKRWPAWLKSAGLTRDTTPTWVQDIVTGGDHTLTARILRLAKVHDLLMNSLSRFGGSPGQDAPPADLLARVFAEAKATVEGWGGHYYLVYVPSYSVLKSNAVALDIRQRMLAAARQAGVTRVIDAYPGFSRNPNALTDYFPFAYSHYNPAGQRAFAEILLARLKQDRVLE